MMAYVIHFFPWPFQPSPRPKWRSSRAATSASPATTSSWGAPFPAATATTEPSPGWSWAADWAPTCENTAKSSGACPFWQFARGELNDYLLNLDLTNWFRTTRASTSATWLDRTGSNTSRTSSSASKVGARDFGVKSRPSLETWPRKTCCFPLVMVSRLWWWFFLSRSPCRLEQLCTYLVFKTPLWTCCFDKGADCFRPLGKPCSHFLLPLMREVCHKSHRNECWWLNTIIFSYNKLSRYCVSANN